jgi:hypothetical protein
LVYNVHSKYYTTSEDDNPKGRWEDTKREKRAEKISRNDD